MLKTSGKKFQLRMRSRKAAMITLYVINKDKTSRIEWADLEIGCMGQNLYLEAAALGNGIAYYREHKDC